MGIRLIGRRLTLYLSVIVVVLALSSCESVILPTVPELPSDSVISVPNFEPAGSTDPFPLFVGARWVYRNATPDFNPEVHAGPNIVQEVVASVQRRVSGTDLAYDSYVLRMRYGSLLVAQVYLHRSSDGVLLHGFEILPYSGAPEMVACSGQPFLALPLAKARDWSFSLVQGSSLESTVVSQEFVPLSNEVWTLLGPYSSVFGNAWRVSSLYAGGLADVFGQGIVEAWYAPGVGMIRRTVESQVYELVTYREQSEVLLLTEDSADRKPSLPVGSVVVVQLRGRAPTSGEAVWNLANRTEVSACGVLSLLSDPGPGSFHADIDSRGRLETGSYVFVFEVRTDGEASLQFERMDYGEPADLVEYRFGREQALTLSNPSVSTLVTEERSTATFSVRYVDEDGYEPSLAYVGIRTRTTSGYSSPSYHRMTYVSGKLADGIYRSVAIDLEEGIYQYCFKFSDDPDATIDDLPGIDCELTNAFDIGGPMP